MRQASWRRRMVQDGPWADFAHLFKVKADFGNLPRACWPSATRVVTVANQSTCLSLTVKASGGVGEKR